MNDRQQLAAEIQMLRCVHGLLTLDIEDAEYVRAFLDDEIDFATSLDLRRGIERSKCRIAAAYLEHAPAMKMTRVVRKRCEAIIRGTMKERRRRRGRH